MSKHDDMVESIIERKRRICSDNLEKCEPEAAYNHYGSRGIADIYFVNREALGQTRAKRRTLYEVKTQPEPANKIIRQFNRMRKYFFKDQNRWYTVDDEILFILAVSPTPEMHEHLRTYWESYRSLLSNTAGDEFSQRQNTTILYSMPDLGIKFPFINASFEKNRQNLAQCAPVSMAVDGVINV